MSETQFVPGPWEVNKGKFAVIFPVRNEERDIRASISLTAEMVPAVYLSSVVNRETKQATAHLIAAAPDLYDAGMNIVQWWESGHPISNEAISMLVVALKKARGEA